MQGLHRQIYVRAAADRPLVALCTRHATHKLLVPLGMTGQE